ncbi:MAG: hypothetical protein BWY19_01124 [bacterium ADurb.Bin212]|nr:MAG: hypothetical protein BWY19_01124 [bacterium ADurb.Bin212]
MKRNIGLFFYYLYTLVKQWVILLGILPFLYDYTSSYLVPFLPEISEFRPPKWLLYLIFSLCFLIANFKLWKEERKKGENIVDYEITSSIDKPDISEDIEKIDKAISKGKTMLLNTKKDNSYFPLPSLNQLLGYNEPDWQKYIERLETTRKKLLDYIENKFYIQLEIQNISTEYDEKINIEITPNAKVVFLEEHLFILDKPEVPKEPKTGFGLTGIDFDFPLIAHKASSIPYREIHKFDEKRIDVTLRELCAKDSAPIIKDGFYIQLQDTELRECELSVKILTKNTKNPITKKVLMIFPEEENGANPNI